MIPGANAGGGSGGGFGAPAGPPDNGCAGGGGGRGGGGGGGGGNNAVQSGTYMVKLTINGQSYSKPVEVIEDKWFKAR
jgi:hypothetical protein